jgi:flavin reductase (DIM6/NTAB) family NADH-FMN oxidoreductase RutF
MSFRKGRNAVTTSATDSKLRQRFLDAMSFTATTVSVVTTDGPAGRHGVTVSALSSVSADSERPTILVCVHERNRASEAIRRNGVFCVNVLRDDQAAISDTFAGRHKDTITDKFSVADWTVEATGSPRIVDPLVALDCELRQVVRQGRITFSSVRSQRFGASKTDRRSSMRTGHTARSLTSNLEHILDREKTD